MSGSLRAVKALPVLRSGLPRRAGEVAQRCSGPSILSLNNTAPRTCQHSSRSVAQGRSWGAGGLRWYSNDRRGSVSSVDSSSAASESGASVASSATSVGEAPQFAFAFDIDGVLLHSSEAIPGATKTLKYLQQHRIPFILLTNGGGKPEAERVADLSSKLGVELNVSNFVQSHTPYQRLIKTDFPLNYELLEDAFHRSVGGPRLSADNTVLVLGSDASKARRIANGYGFKSVVTPGDIIKAHPEIFPFDPLTDFYNKQETQPLPKPIYSPSAGSDGKLEDCLKIDAIMVFNDPRDWALDIQLVTDLLLSHRGYLGTYSRKNGDSSLPSEEQWQGDGQPALIFSNADLLWSTGYHLSRLGQGSFHGAVERVWSKLVRNAGSEDRPLRYFTFGKPQLPTYWYAWDILQRYYQEQQAEAGENSSDSLLHKVYMVGDNPESDIRGVHAWNSRLAQRTEDEKRDNPAPEWTSLLVRTGVWAEDKMPLNKIDEAARPHQVTDNVQAAVNLALEKEGWPGRVE